MLGRGELRCIGATTLDEYRKYIEKDPALERRFQQVLVDPPSVVDTISILRGLRERLVFYPPFTSPPSFYTSIPIAKCYCQDGVCTQGTGGEEAVYNNKMEMSA